MNKTTHGTITLFSGRTFNPLFPSPESFTLLDIAHSLSMECRFANHSNVFYSVAQHCVIMSKWFEKKGMVKEAKWALLHEGSEGLGLKDLPTPIKYLEELTAYRSLCKDVDNAVFKKFGLIGKPPASVKELDDLMKVAEVKVLFPQTPDWAKDVKTKGLVIKPYKSSKVAKETFIKAFKRLFPEYSISL